jgi:hypothetical protein
MTYKITAKTAVQLFDLGRVLQSGESADVEKLTAEFERAKAIGLISIEEQKSPSVSPTTETLEPVETEEIHQPAENATPKAKTTGTKKVKGK